MVTTEREPVGPPASIEQLYQEAYLPLLRLAVLLTGDRSVAEDCVQEAFVSIWRRADGLREPRAAHAYLRTAVVNASRTTHRRRRTVRRHLRALVPDDVRPADDDLLRTERDAILRAAVDALPRRQREVVILRYWQDLPYAEIGAALGISEGSARSNASRALSHLQLSWEA
ncbi:RNA polymerase sigma factor [Nakamurella alba]|uniref:RNA polymerase sigma factor n=1 Tax=Nakamurella alba TaxID=2665158 RepID=UPI0018ABEE50|nr:sigma-70 family RNA polymerase sigma factor [Nakamurella alba]